MPHYRSLAEVRLEKPSIVTIGVFDGVHRGHQYLIRRLVETARARGQLSVAITFYPHPDVVIRGITGRYYLTTPEERAEILMALGIDVVITLPFDDDLRHIRAAAFVDQMNTYLQLETLWVGSDFALGYQREGNVTFLRQQGEEKGFGVEVIDLLLSEGGAISSTVIRDALTAGDVVSARHLLGRSYAVSGEVVHGEARGRKIGFPTANIAVPESLVIPANGVYAGWGLLGDERFMAVTNVGLRPTFNGQSVTVEAHLLDFNRDIYGETLGFTFETRLRPEMRFSGIDALISQIAEDSAAARAYLSALRVI
jgi:riboflavin kinase/FMN adenylyltransferase